MTQRATCIDGCTSGQLASARCPPLRPTLPLRSHAADTTVAMPARKQTPHDFRTTVAYTNHRTQVV
eukprot:4210478-Pleurochrysis_carterae.AAC.1